jgi:hypothetical protein
MSVEQLHIHVTVPQEIRLCFGADAASEVCGGQSDGMTNATAAYLLTGGGVPLLTAEHRILLAEMASVLTGQVVRLEAMTATDRPELPWPLMAEREPEPEPQPVPITKSDFTRFGLKHRYPKVRAGRVWNTVSFTESHDEPEQRHLPAIRYLQLGPGADERTLDLRSVQERLVASQCQSGAWRRATKADVAFLIHLVEEWMENGTSFGA